MLLLKSHVLLQFDLATHLQPLASLGSALSPRSPSRCDEPLSSPQQPGMLIPDDLMQEITKLLNNIIVHTQHTPSWLVHHQAVAKPYPREWEQASQKHNYHYMVLFRNPANTRYAKALGNQWLGDSLAFWQVYLKATHQPFGYLVIDDHPICIHTHFLWEELKPVTVLQPKSVRKR